MRREMSSGFALFAIAVAALTVSACSGGGGDGDAVNSDGAYSWVPAQLIPNEFGLPNGTWAQASMRDCINKCSADKSCSGFSVEKKFGDAWRAGCKDGLCDQKTECHAKGTFGSAALWTPTDTQIRVPKVDAQSNAWIGQWGTILKK